MSSKTEPEYITIGTIISPWGLQGHIKVNVETDFPQRFSPSSQVYIDGKMMIINEVTWHKGNVIIKLLGVDTEEEADNLKGDVIEVHHSQLFNLKEDEYYYFQLIDLEVCTTGGDVIGKIKEVLRMASADIYVIDGDSGEILIPATDEIVQFIDLDKGIMIIEPMDGLLDLNRKKTK